MAGSIVLGTLVGQYIMTEGHIRAELLYSLQPGNREERTGKGQGKIQPKYTLSVSYFLTS
jgi:hypothetical protein